VVRPHLHALKRDDESTRKAPDSTGRNRAIAASGTPGAKPSTRRSIAALPPARMPSPMACSVMMPGNASSDYEPRIHSLSALPSIQAKNQSMSAPRFRE
jgi:hypothetical protein